MAAQHILLGPGQTFIWTDSHLRTFKKMLYIIGGRRDLVLVVNAN